MAARNQANKHISPLQAFVFASALGLTLALVLAPVLPGDAPLEAGDAAFKTFESGGEVIVEEGQAVSQADLTRIKNEGLLGNELTFGAALAATMVGLLGGVFMGLYLYLYQPREVNTVPRLLMVGLLVLVAVAAAKILLSLTLPDGDRMYLAYILPVAAAPMLAVTLLDDGLAITVAAVVGLLAAFAGFYMPDARSPLAAEALDPLQMSTAFLAAGLTGVYAVKRAERVNAFGMAGVLTAAVTFGVLFAFWLLASSRQAEDVLWMIFASALGGFASAVITIGATVVLGMMFGITTRIQLMELAQLSHPLLRQLQEKAPGTFHHSVIVGNLGERAADLVGADPLLVRVGAYFHDIGKIARPSYYIENTSEGVNPHDKLPPGQSARLVTDHVRIGLELTARYRVPEKVRAFVPQHHGTRLVTYFYRKASAEDPTIDPDKFRYPGPRPQSKETAIVMLSDSVEAVVRASKDRSYEKIDELVDSVIAERVTEGQLDECDLTLRDLKTVAESFKSTLRGIYHPRIEYPAPTTAELQAAPVGVAYLKPPIEAPPAER